MAAGGGRTMSWRRVLPAAAVAVSLGLAAGACSSSSTTAAGDVTSTAPADSIVDEGTPVDGGKLVFGVNAETSGWNPHDNQWAQVGSLVGSSVLEPLAALDGDLNPVPWLATSWTANETFDSYTIVLREGVTFHNGEAFDATAVKANLDDVTKAALTSVVWKAIIAETTVVDAHTVKVDLTQPFAAFPTSFLASQTAIMMAPATFTAENRGTDHPIGTGPFEFQAWEPGATFEATKFDDYWQEGLPHLAEIEFKVVTDSSAVSTGLQADDLDMAFTPSVAAVELLPDDFTVIKDWSSEPGMAITNTLAEVDGKPNPMANPHARKALAYATNRQALAEAVGEGVQSPNSPFPPESKWGMEPGDNNYPDFDPARAREEVAAYEQETGSPIAITLSASAGTDTEGIVQLLQSQWADVGITTTIESVESTAFISNVVGGKYQVALFNIYSSPDPDQNNYFWSAKTANGPGTISINFTQFTTPTMEANLEIGRRSNVFEERKAAFDSVVREINGATVNIWTYSTPYSIVANERVHGLGSASEVPFGNFQPKTWFGDLWLQD